MQCDVIKNKAANTNLKLYGGNSPFSSDKVQQKIKKTNLDKYGVEYPVQSDEIKKKIEQTNLIRYGTKHSLQNKDIYQKVIDTCIKKYGVDNPSKSSEIKEKIKDTHMSKYGVPYAMQNADVHNKQLKTMRERYGHEYPLQIPSIKSTHSNTMNKVFGHHNPMELPQYQRYMRIKKKQSYWDTFIAKLSLKKIEPKFDITYYINNIKFPFKCTRCDKEFMSIETNPQKINCGCLKFRSSYEHDIIDWIRSIYIDTVTNNEFFTDTELNRRWESDIFIPKLNIAIEFHGLYWHSDIHKHKNYHQDKYTFFKSQNITLIQIFESEWVHKQDIVKSIIKSKINLNERIFARKTVLKEITTSMYRTFVDENHIQGYCHSKIKIGLFNDSDLVAVIGISKSRFNTKYEWELIRFCNKLNTNVIGGFNKMLKYTLIKYDITTLGTFCDLRYFDGHGYINSNFIFSHITQPNYFYFKINDNVLYPRTQFQKHKLDKKLPLYDDNKTEYENMIINKYLRIFDAGNHLFILDNTTL